MPTYAYKAYDKGGSSVTGTIEAAGQKEAVQAVRNTGLYPTDIKEEGRTEGRIFGGRIGSAALAATARQLATLLSAGTGISEALQVLTENTDNPRLRSVLNSVRDGIVGGSSLAKALEGHPEVFSPLFRGLVSAGEASGSLDSVLPRLADYLEKRARIEGELRAALTYPVLMTVVGISVVSFLFVFVIPKISRIFEDTGARLPFITVMLLWAADAVRAYWPVMAGAAGGSAWLLRRKARTGSGRDFIDRTVIRLPWFGPIATSFIMANFARTLGSLLKGGVQMLKALEITREVLNHAVYDRAVNGAIKDCTEGSSLSATLKKSGVFPPILTHMISVGERSGRLDEMLIKAAESYDLEFENGIKKSMSLLEPLLILAMGVVVGFIVLAMLLPIFELNQAIH